MTTLVDLTALPAEWSGVGRYLDELVHSLREPVVLVCQPRDEQHYRERAPLARVVAQHGIGRVWARLLWEQFVLPHVARTAGVSVIHSPHYTLPLFTRRARVVTFHDATFFSDPGVHTYVRRVFFRAWMRVSVRRASRVIVPSQATADELTRFIGKPRDSYRVIHHGVDRAVFRPQSARNIAAAAAALGLGGTPWIAFLGRLEPRKNLPALLDAYNVMVRNWDSTVGPVPTLALAGGAGWGPELDSAIADARTVGRVARLGYIDLALVPAFLSGALLVTYPSLGEGFGLPLLEAMACGAPVLTTERLALPEVGGNAVAYAEPDAASLASALLALATDSAERRRLSGLALARASQFTWQDCAAAHVAVYREATGS